MADDDDKPGDQPAQPSDIRPVSIFEEMKKSYLDYANERDRGAGAA
ncbi:DNA gyrase/topoisomerase IV subunit A [Bradyrhizobium sp. LM6.11]